MYTSVICLQSVTIYDKLTTNITIETSAKYVRMIKHSYLKFVNLIYRFNNKPNSRLIPVIQNPKRTNGP